MLTQALGSSSYLFYSLAVQYTDCFFVPALQPFENTTPLPPLDHGPVHMLCLPLRLILSMCCFGTMAENCLGNLLGRELLGKGDQVIFADGADPLELLACAGVAQESRDQAPQGLASRPAFPSTPVPKS